MIIYIYIYKVKIYSMLECRYIRTPSHTLFPNTFPRTSLQTPLPKRCNSGVEPSCCVASEGVRKRSSEWSSKKRS